MESVYPLDNSQDSKEKSVKNINLVLLYLLNVPYLIFSCKCSVISYFIFLSEFYYHTFNSKAPGPVTAGFIESVLIKHFHMDFTGSTGV